MWRQCRPGDPSRGSGVGVNFEIPVLASPAVGYIVYFTVGSLQGIVASGWTSLILCVGLSLVFRSSYDWSILHNYGRREVEEDQ